MSGSPEYRCYAAAKNRCQNPNAERWAEYGGRGIEFRFVDFEAFFAEVGPRPSSRLTVDRIDVEGHYEPGNVQWATKKEQALNRRCALILEFQGRKQNLSVWSEELGIGHSTILHRLSIGWSVERALSTPVGPTAGRMLTYQGKTQRMAAWAKELGLPGYVIRQRLAKGWSIEDALGTPPLRVGQKRSTGYSTQH